VERSAVGKTQYFTRIDELEHLSEQERAELKKVADRFAFRCNDYYFSLINWDDANDPIRRIVIPDTQELEEWGRLDPSAEKTYTVIPGLEHKYNSTVLMLVSNVCEGICRYCFRKRVFMKSQKEYLHDLPAALRYLRDHAEITNVLLTGGDPLVLSTSQLEDIVRPVREIEHVRIIRIGTKIPAFNPYRITDDPGSPGMLGAHSTEGRKIYVMTHFVHPRELTAPAMKAVNLLQKVGVEVANQTPLIKGVNDNPTVLADLLAELSFIGAVPYYIFQCRPASGNKDFNYHRAALGKDRGRFLVFKSNPTACWFDDYEEIIQDYPMDLPYRSYGPE